MTSPLAGAPSRVATARLALRPFAAADAEAFDALVMSSIEHLLPWEPWAADEPHPLPQRRRDLADLAEQLAAGTATHYAIERLSDGALMGSAGLVPGADSDAIEVGYWLGVDHLGQGYATEAVLALTLVGLETVGIARLEAWADVDNAASNSVVERCGYRRVGTRRSHWHDGDDAPLMAVWAVETADLAREPLASATRPNLGEP